MSSPRFRERRKPMKSSSLARISTRGIANVGFDQESASYGPNYHGRSDTYDKCDVRVLRQNAMVVAAFVFGFATMPDALPRQSRPEIETIMKRTDLEQQMRSMGMWDGWAAGTRGRRP